MESYIWIAVFLVIIIPLINQRRRRVAIIKQVLKNKKLKKENKAMIELAKQFIGKECIVYTIMGNDTPIKGTIKEVTDGGIIVERKDSIEVVNMEYVTRIREWPRNSKGKKKTIFE